MVGIERSFQQRDNFCNVDFFLKPSKLPKLLISLFPRVNPLLHLTDLDRGKTFHYVLQIFS